MTYPLARSSQLGTGRPVRQVLLAATIAVAAVTFGTLPALAQQRGGIDYGYEAPPGQRFNPDFPGGRGALPDVNTQERIASRIEARRFEGPRQLLRAAGDAVRQNQWGRANELLERAETDVLNIRALNMGNTRGGPLVNIIGNARDAVVHGDTRDALRSIRRALSRIDDTQMMVEQDRFGRDRFERDYRAGQSGRGDMDRFQSLRDPRDYYGGYSR